MDQDSTMTVHPADPNSKQPEVELIDRAGTNGSAAAGEEEPHTDGLTRELDIPTKKQKSRKRKHTEVENVDKVRPSIFQDGAASSPIAQQEQGSNTKSNKKSKKTQPVRTKWKVSEPVGGSLADLLPVFSLDEEHLLLGYSHSVKVYSAKTSLLVRVCQTGGTRISSFCLSSQTPTTLYILLQDGKIQWWDWTKGQRLKTWDLGAQVSDIAVSTLSSAPEAADTLFIAESRKGGSEISAHRLLGNEETAAKSLYQEKQAIRKIKTLDHGRYIVAITSNTVIIGTRANSPTATKLKQMHYTFNTFDAPEPITCFDARISSRGVLNKLVEANIDVAIGLGDGSIRVYYDAAISADQGTKTQRITPKNEKLHWHRQAVSSVAWASDGNYLLSGGSETVLVLWQLDTKAKTTLPHLMSNIEGIKVSPKGSSYAIRLSDNSAMILATTDFVPTFNTSGLGFPSLRPYEEKPLDTILPHRRTPITCILTQPPRLISAVPSDIQHESNAGIQSGSFANTSLQSSPLSSLTMTVSRQALVDNNTTSIRQNPDGKVMTTPNVVLLEVTHSGNWLATVDEWYQPFSDILPNSINEQEARFKQLDSVETNLVLWHWNEVKEVWDKSTRFMDPHLNDDDPTQATSLILDLVAVPKRDAFWTLGSDGSMKYWAPYRADKIGSRMAKADSEYIWKCSRSISVPSTGFINGRDDLLIPSGRLVISKDESVFAVSSMSSIGSELTVFTLQADNTTKHIITINLGHRAVSVLLLNQYLVVTDCESVLVRNLTDSTKWYQTSLGSDPMASDLQTPSQIAADHENQLFAISVPRKNKSEASNKARKSRISIFSPLSSNPIATLDNQPLSAALLCVPEQRKFYALTAEAELYSIGPNLGGTISDIADTAPGISEDETPQLNKQSSLLSNIFGSNPSDKTQAIEENNTIVEVRQPRKKIPWDEIPGLNLSLPFALPKTSAIQMMSAMAVKG